MQTQMVSLLQHIANQSYSLNGAYLNVSSPLPPAEPFDVPIWALRVNGLWFASLILSLAAASLGMLVKSWLREYLNLGTDFPRERLRARYYRAPAMNDWYVYEIVALLPILLQLALALFFIGLCLFTASVDRRMRYTTLPLVAVWAAFLIFTFLAPLFSPRCPWKVHALKATQKLGRRYVKFVRRKIRSWLVVRLNRKVSGNLKTIEGEKVITQNDTVEGSQTTETNAAQVAPLLERPSTDTPISLSDDDPPMRNALEVATTPHGLPVHQQDPTKEDNDQEEEEVVATEAHDIDVLVEADIVMSDDNLIDAMWEVLKHADIDPSKTIKFVWRLLRHRGVTNMDGQPLPDKPSFSDLCLANSDALSSKGTPLVPDKQHSLVHAGDVVSPLPRAEPSHSSIPAHSEPSASHSAASPRFSFSLLWEKLHVALAGNTIPPSDVERSSSNIVPYMNSPHTPDVAQAPPIEFVFLDMHALSSKAYIALMAIVADTLVALPNDADFKADWIRTASLLLLSNSPYSSSVPIPDGLVVPVCQAVTKHFLLGGSPSPDVASTFAQRIVQRRLGISMAEVQDLESIVNLTPLSESAYRALMTMTARAIQVEERTSRGDRKE